MAAVALDRSTLALAALGLAALWVTRRGVAGAAADAGAAVVNAAGGAVSGGVTAVSTAIGIPTPADTTTDPAVARYLIDNFGWLTASLWSGAPALFAASGMPAGSGRRPPAGSAVALALGIVPPTSGDFARLDRASYVEPAAPIDYALPWRFNAEPLSS